MKVLKAVKSPHIPRPSRETSRRDGFTLIEIMIVVVIIGILAAMVVPQFSNASQSARENTLKDELRYLRTQIIVYRAQHRDVAPGYTGGNPAGRATTTDFVAQLTENSDELGNVSPTVSSVYHLGPYLQKMPTNPMNSLDTVLIVANGASIPAADDSTGWIYKPQTQELIANKTGNDSDGNPYTQY